MLAIILKLSWQCWQISRVLVMDIIISIYFVVQLSAGLSIYWLKISSSVLTVSENLAAHIIVLMISQLVGRKIRRPFKNIENFGNFKKYLKIHFLK